MIAPWFLQYLVLLFLQKPLHLYVLYRLFSFTGEIWAKIWSHLVFQRYLIILQFQHFETFIRNIQAIAVS